MAKIEYLTVGKKIDFEDGTKINLLGTSIRYQCDVPYKCGGGFCGECKVKIEQGSENLTSIRKQELKQLGEDIDKGYRLACMAFAMGDVKLSWKHAMVKVPERLRIRNEKI